MNVQCIGDVPAVDVNVVTDEADNSGIVPVVAHVSEVVCDGGFLRQHGVKCHELILEK